MVSVTKDPRSRDEKFCVKLSEPGMGFRAVVYRNLTLQEAHACVDHYYGGAQHKLDPLTCPLCRVMQ